MARKLSDALAGFTQGGISHCLAQCTEQARRSYP